MPDFKATSAQRYMIEKFIRELELDTRRISLMHKSVFLKAGLWSSTDLDLSLVGFINNLSKGDASRLISALQSEIAL